MLLSICLCRSLPHISLFLFFQQAAALTRQGFDILLLSHKPGARFLLTSHENSWLKLLNGGVWRGAPRLRFASSSSSSSDVNICCPGPDQAQRVYQPLAGAFDVRGPAELVKLLLDAHTHTELTVQQQARLGRAQKHLVSIHRQPRVTRAHEQSASTCFGVTFAEQRANGNAVGG